MDDPTGIDGELVDRLIGAVNSHDDDWVDLSWFLVFAVGGAELWAAEPDTGRDPPPGSVGAERRKTRQLLSRPAYVERVRERLMSLVRSGVREDFLVRAVRDELTTNRQEFADTEGASTRREEMRARIERDASSPEAVAAFRAALSRSDPEAASLTDADISERLRRMAGSELLGPMSPRAEQEAWARVARWNDQVAARLSDRALAVWFDRHGRRLTS